MFSSSDLLALLDRIELWKRLKKAPSELDELRERVQKLEDRLAQAKGDQCPKCREMTFTVTASELDRTQPGKSLG
ncbi:hypothetical protein EO087_00070 [Dyella sp. M7H15-1]|uniref:hypothetical protein n=1 Tax=Dyella sp. M7H15-1 TaxID=2501295 RepID=UPI0010050349|nr:hypothetical protein [Dyella sp. M7H15-1]QAU22565.1 hypothetical protein EO087_00070 [Dyella sp. M7H15-1]